MVIALVFYSLSYLDNKNINDFKTYISTTVSSRLNPIYEEISELSFSKKIGESVSDLNENIKIKFSSILEEIHSMNDMLSFDTL